MAVELMISDLSLKAAADLSAKQFLGMKVSADFTVNVADAANAALLGILQNKPAAANRAAQVRTLGLSKAILGADSITAGTPLTTDANGKFVTATAGQRYCAMCLEGGDTDDIVTVHCETGSV